MLHHAANNNHIDIVKILLSDKRFIEVNAANKVSRLDYLLTTS